MINRALLEMVVAENGPTTWAEVSRQAGVEGIVFLRNQFHPDALTFRIAHVACARLGEEPAAFLARFGRFFVRVADRLNYGDLFDLIGTTLPDFVRNLPNFHDRNALIFPELSAPSFRCSDVAERSLVLKHYSPYPEAASFLMGMLQGFAERFGMRVSVTHQERCTQESGFDRFLLQWEKIPS